MPNGKPVSTFPGIAPSVERVPTRFKLRLHHITRTRQLGDDAINIALLPFEPFDAFAELRQRDLQLGHLPVAEIVEVEHLAHFLEREADGLAGKYVGEPRAVAPGVEPLLDLYDLGDGGVTQLKVALAKFGERIERLERQKNDIDRVVAELTRASDVMKAKLAARGRAAD